MNQLPPIVEKINSVFENDTTQPMYNYCENLDDGRGFTFGKIGFTTANGDGLELIQKYCNSNPESELAQYLPVLEKLAEEENDDTNDLQGFEEAWQQEAEQTIPFQDEVAWETYGKPAVQYCQTLGLQSTMALACIYDTIVQHGDGDDDDSIGALLKNTVKEMGGSLSGNNANGSSCDMINDPEQNFIDCFLVQRKKCLMNPANKDTRDEWRESADRVVALKNLLDTNNLNLEGTIQIQSNDWNTEIA